MIVGMDFGTTNSGMAVFDGRQVTLLPIDPSNNNPRIARSALYVTNDQSIAIGRAAVNRYFEHNLGRPIRLEKVWVGEIEMVFAELPAFIRDVYAWVDALSPGRLFLSFKTGLREAHYPGTVVGQFFLPLEDLIATYLYATKRRAERALGRELGEIVLGRPVRFSTDPQADRVAQERLIEAALRAGYERVYLEYEPTAAAFHYAASVAREQNILIFDFGGGTLDITVMRVSPKGKREVLATGGLPIAGDVFDQKLLRGRLASHFGEGTSYGPRSAPLPVPTWIFDTLADWQQLITLQQPEHLKTLREMQATSREPRKLQALIDLVTGNYGLRLFEVVEAAKRRLSQHTVTDIRLLTPTITVRQPVTRTEFESIIHAEYLAIDALVDDTLMRSGLEPRAVDAVIRTGGSSEIPLFQAMLTRKFGADKVRSIDIFSSVTSGLGIIAHSIAQGEIEGRGYGRDGHTRAALTAVGEARADRPNVTQVNLDLLKRRIDTAEETEAGETGAATPGLLLFGDHRLVVAQAAPALAHPTAPIALADLLPDTPCLTQTALAARPDEPILLVTSKYRLLLVTLRQLASLQEGGFDRADLRDFEPDEVICAVARWSDLREASRLLLVTSRGFGRGLNMALSRGAIEGPRPLKLDWAVANWPAAVLGATPGDDLIAVTSGGRVTRTSVSGLSVQGGQLVKLNKTKGERLVAVLAGGLRDQLLLLTVDGHARRVPVSVLPTDADNGVALARREVAAAALVRPGATVWAATTARLLPFDPAQVPLDRETTSKTHALFKLAEGECITSALQTPPAQPVSLVHPAAEKARKLA